MELFLFGFVAASAIIGPAAYFLGLRRRAPTGENLGDMEAQSLAGGRPRIPPK